MKLTLGFSPCPNDTFIFDALVHHKIYTEGLDFDIVLADVEELNQRAFSGDLDITKLSFHAYGHLIDNYVLLDSGSALGRNCGPLLIARKPLPRESLAGARVAIPGKYTTANFLLGLAYPEIKQKQEVLFSEIEDKVLNGTFDAGLIIHENRFTYAEKGLLKISDLGEYWESTTQMPIPLGGIVANRKLPTKVIKTMNRVLHNSIKYAFENGTEKSDFVTRHAQEMEPEVLKKHIDLYVNDFTLSLGKTGRAAVEHLFATARDKGIIPASKQSVFG